jgi:type II secretion system protein H
VTGGRPPGRRHASPAANAGFTLIELMVVCLLLGTVLLLVPPALDGYGAKGRLEQGASLLAEAISSARDTAINDGHTVILEYDLEKDRFRSHVSARLREREVPPQEGQTVEERPALPEPEEEWAILDWMGLPTEVDLTAYSEAKDVWESGAARTILVSFSPEGIVRPGHALRVESKSLPKESRTMTVRVNALTSLSEVVPGTAEMPEKREPSDFR